MSQLGPVIGNRLADARKAALKPHLRVRLALGSCRSTPLGTVAKGADGRLSFTPNYVFSEGRETVPSQPSARQRSAFQPGQRVRVDATVNELLEQHLDPFEPQEATALADREGIVVGRAGCASLGLVLVMIEGIPWWFVPGYLAHAGPVDGGNKQPAMTGEGAVPAFDPYREPLAVGDTVQGMDGRLGHVTLAERRRLGVVFEGGGARCGDLVWRCSFRIIRKAGDCG